MSFRPVLAVALYLLLPSLSTATTPAQATAAQAPRIVSAKLDLDSLKIEFDQPMITWTGTSASPIARFVPAASCAWFWEDDTTLACESARSTANPGFRAATPYRISLAPGLWSQSGVAVAPESFERVAALPELRAEVTDWRKGQPRILLQGDLPMTATDIAAALDFSFDGKPLAYSLVPLTAAERGERWMSDQVTAYRLQPQAWPRQEGLLSLQLREGLRSTVGPARGEAQQLLELRVNESLRLVATACGYSTPSLVVGPRKGKAAIRCGADAPVTLVFSGRLAEGEAARVQAALPGLRIADGGDQQPCRYACGSKGGAWLSLKLQSTLAGTTLALVLPADLRSDDDRLLEPGPPVELRFGDHPEQVRAMPRARLLRPGGDAALALELRNLTSPRVLSELGIGTRPWRRDTALPAASADNLFRAWRAKAPRGGVADDGGLVLAGLRGRETGGFAVAVAPFNVVASEDPRRLLVWATDWDTGAALAGARVEVFSVTAKGRETPLAKGRTGDDGVAYLPRPAPATDEDEVPRLVRVSHNGRQSVIPVLNRWSRLTVASIPDPEATQLFGPRYSGAGMQVFGVSDRLLYRPGDRVDFRLWSRNRDGNRLRQLPGNNDGSSAAGMKLKLVAIVREETVAEWAADRDRWGGSSGQLPLSAQLGDGAYCITLQKDTPNEFQPSGACFEVARFDAQPVWAKAKFDQALVRPGAALALEVEGGFYSGGAAAGAALETTSFFEPASLGEVYPALAKFSFAPVRGEVEQLVPLAGFGSVAALDGKGRAKFSGHLPAALMADDGKDPVAFGRIKARASISVPGQPMSTSPTASVVYARDDRYVGLHVEGWWLSSGADPMVEATVATAEGTVLAEATVSVRIEAVAARGEQVDETPAVLARCELRVGVPAPCAFRAPKPGQYRFVAESAGATETGFSRYFYAGDVPAEIGRTQVELSVLTPSDGRSDAVLHLLQPHARASALFVVEYGEVKKHWVQSVGPDVRITLPVQADWAPAVSVRVLLRPDVSGSAVDPLTLPTLSGSTRVKVPRATAAPVGVRLDQERSAPGEQRTIYLHNPGTAPRLVTLAVMDDSVHQQANWLHDLIDPAGARWLGLLERWTGADWYGYGDWDYLPNLFREVAPASERAYAPPADFAGDDSSTLDTIEVTGSRIKRSELEALVPATVIAPPPEAAPAEGRPAARVRSRFPVTAYWNPGVELAPGESRELRFTLPDNLTRWRLLAWTSDEADGFALSESTLEASLPLEIRAGLPGRLFEGDQGSGTVTARVNGDQAAAVSLQVETEGAGAGRRVSAEGNVAAQASLPLRVPLQPTATGEVALLAQAATATASDALSSSVQVQTREIDASVAQAGWLEHGPLSLARPELPRGAMSPVLHLSVAQGTDPWRDGWMQSLRDYPHRCWEQTLSRGLGAAFALASPDAAKTWPGARAVLDETLRDAHTFRDEDRNFRYFIGSGGGEIASEVDPVLSAYTLRGFQWLEQLGHVVPGDLHDELASDLSTWASRKARGEIGRPYGQVDAVALVAGALAAEGKPLPASQLQALWLRRDDLSWYARSELVRALAADESLAGLAAQGLDHLRGAGRAKGVRRILEDERDLGFLMGSNLRDQCAIVATLWTLDTSAEHRPVREQWLRGLMDLYAGGAGSLDTQSSAQCLVALQAAGAALGERREAATVMATTGTDATRLSLPPGAGRVDWSTPLATDAMLRLVPEGDSDGTLNYSAQVSYRFDQRNVVAQGTGMHLQRSYQVLRGRTWVELGEGAVSEGEWVRTTLRLVVPAMRHFVAITDTVPGGLVTKDVRLGGVAGEDVQRLADEGSWWFDTRQTTASEVRFYARQLPPGRHDLHYYTQATHAGRYFAPPAVAELMYGRNSRANTGPADLRVVPAR